MREIGTNEAWRKRKPYRNIGGHGATIAQTNTIRMLERRLGQSEKDLKGMHRADVADYIALLLFRCKKAGKPIHLKGKGFHSGRAAR